LPLYPGEDEGVLNRSSDRAASQFEAVRCPECAHTSPGSDPRHRRRRGVRRITAEGGDDAEDEKALRILGVESASSQ
jgi:hypothetical protein